MEMIERTEKFTNEEFKNLNRYENGDIKNLSMNFMWITNDQRDQVSDDDWSRIGEYEEECRFEIAEFLKWGN